MDVSKRLLVPYSAERMFDLIEAAEHYPQFMPWCASAAIVERSDEVVVADIVVQHRGVRFDFRTRNPKRRPHAMSIRLERGPFRRFQGEWRLAALGNEGCRIEFEMRYDFNDVMARFAGPVFDRITNAMVDAYVARAEALYGGEARAQAQPCNAMASSAPDSGSREVATGADPTPAMPRVPRLAAADAVEATEPSPVPETPSTPAPSPFESRASTE